MAKRKGLSLLELVVALAVISSLLAITSINFNRLTQMQKVAELQNAQRAVGSAIVQLMRSGNNITTGYYTPAQFQSIYGLPIPPNPVGSGNLEENQWYIENVSGDYFVYPVSNGSRITSAKYVVSDDFPFIKSMAVSYSSPTTTEYSSSFSSNPIRSHNLLVNGDFEQAGTAWLSGNNLFTYNQETVETDTSGFSAVLGAALSRTSAERYEGNYSLRVSTTGASAYQGVNIKATGTILPGSYTFSVRLKAPAGTPMRLLTSNGTNSNEVSFNASGSWEQKSLTFVVTSTSSFLDCQVTLNNSLTPVVFYLDGNELYPTLSAGSGVVISPIAYQGERSLAVNVKGTQTVKIKQELLVTDVPQNRYFAVFHFKNSTANPSATQVVFNFYYKTATSDVFSYTWTPSLSDYNWQEYMITSSSVNATGGTIGVSVTVRGTNASAEGQVLIDDLRVYLLPGGE